MIDKHMPHLFLWSRPEDPAGLMACGLGAGASTGHLICAARLLEECADQRVLLAGLGRSFEQGGLSVPADGLIIAAGHLDPASDFTVIPNWGRRPTRLELWTAAATLDMMGRNEIAKNIARNEIERERQAAKVRRPIVLPEED